MTDAFLCNINCSIKEAWEKININARRMVIIIDDAGRLKGTVSDGDIRRGILGGLSINDNLSEVLHFPCKYLKQSDMRDEIVYSFDDFFTVIPVVDDNMIVVDCIEGTRQIAIAEPSLSEREFQYLTDAFLSTWISSTGKYIQRFEDEFSTYCEKEYGIAVSNGTSALHLALLALGIGPGDEVIVPDITFAATINAVLYTGATPVIVDIEEESWCIDPERIEEAVSDRTKAVIPVHIYGQPCDMKRIMEIAERHHLHVVEDCAEAHGAEYAGHKVGSFGVISCFSFFGNKVMTTGEGGMCITDDPELADRMRILRDHGMSKTHKYYHEMIGYNYRMTNLQAAIGVAQLEQLDSFLEGRHRLEKMYRNQLSNISGLHFQRDDLPDRKKITWLVTAYVDDEKEKENLFRKMKEDHIDVRSFFVPLSEMDIYREYAFGDITVSRRISKVAFNLPTANRINEEVIGKVIESMNLAMGAEENG